MLNLANVKRTLTMSAETETASEPSQLLSVNKPPRREKAPRPGRYSTKEEEGASEADWKREQIKGRGSPAGDHHHSNAAQTIKVKQCRKTWKMTEMQQIWWSVQMLEDSFKYEGRVQTWGSLHGYISADGFLQTCSQRYQLWELPLSVCESSLHTH